MTKREESTLETEDDTSAESTAAQQQQKTSNDPAPMIDGIVTDVAPHLSDAEKLDQAKRHLRDDQVLAAARLVECIKNEDTLLSDNDSAFQQEVERKASLVKSVITDLLTNPEEDEALEENDVVGPETTEGKWTKMGETHSANRDTIMYYQLTDDLQLKCRLETPIESSLLVPLLSVLIETDLYTSWLPCWNYPRIGLDKVEKIAQIGRTEQVVKFVSRVPWPFQARDVLLQTLACDDIDDIDGPSTGTITIALRSLEEGNEVRKSTVAQDHYKDVEDVMVVPPCPEGMKRAEFEGGLLIRKCPDDHISLRSSTIEYPPQEHLILVGFSMRIDGKISPMFPTSIINFVIRTVISAMWQKFLDLAEEIRSGSRPQHAEAIANKRGEIYDWVEKRIEDMFAQLQQDGPGPDT